MLEVCQGIACGADIQPRGLCACGVCDDLPEQIDAFAATS
jgi:hypothetical protein